MSIYFSEISDRIVGSAPIKSNNYQGATMYNESIVAFLDFIENDYAIKVIGKNNSSYGKVYFSLLQEMAKIGEIRKMDAQKNKNITPHTKMARDLRLEMLEFSF